MKSSRIFAICATLWCCSYLARVQCQEKALIFDQETKQLLERFEFDYAASCSHCITACAASTNSYAEFIINQNVAIDGSGVFLRDVYQPELPTREINADICDTRLTPTLVWNTAMEYYEIGYELFHDGEGFELKNWDFEKLRKVINGEPDKNPRQVPDNDTITPHYDHEKASFTINYEGHTSHLVYYWIEVLSIMINSAENQRIVFFVKDRVNYYFHKVITIASCPVYYLGDRRIQANANPETSNQSVGDRLQKTQIIPMRMFHTLSARLATCTYLNFAFVWKSVAEGLLKKVDLFLYALYRVYPEVIKISFGVLGDLQVDPEQRQRIAHEDQVFRQFPIPQILYRIVEYEFDHTTVYQTIVVIHNDPATVQETGRICTVEEEIDNWDDIKNAGDMPGLSYACPVTKTLCERLGVERGVVLTDVLRPLDLAVFPYGRGPITGQMFYKSELQKVRDELAVVIRERIVD